MILIFFSVARGIKSSGKALLPTMIINLTLQFRAYSKIGLLSATIKTFSLDSLTVVVNVCDLYAAAIILPWISSSNLRILVAYKTFRILSYEVFSS